MAFIGNTNTTQAFTPAIDYFSGTGSATAFTLSRPVASVAQVQVTIDNVAQNPSSAYTISGSTITFTSAPLSGTNNIYVYYTSPITQVIAPGQGTVTSASFGAITNFTTTGNTILGDASTDTLNVGNGGLVKDASGNVGIGTSSPATMLNLSRDSGLSTGSGTTVALRLTDTSSDGGTGAWNTTQQFTAVQFFSADGSGAGAAIRASVGATMEAGSGGTTALTFFTNSSGTPAERARIDSSGNLLVGATSAFVAMPANLQGSGSSGQLGLRNSGATAGKYWTLGPNPSNNIVLYNQSSVGVYIVDGGTSWTGSSDERLKTDLQPIENATAKVATLRAVTGRFKTDAEDVSRAFLIAQDVQAVLPEAVNQLDDEIGTLGLQYTDVIPLLVAAIKEQSQLITTLTARITALESR